MGRTFVNLGVALETVSYDTLYVDEASEVDENNDVFLIAV